MKEPQPDPEQETYTQLPQCELMQFTGLTDKNGKDIYEGDIVKHDLPGYLPFVVEWDSKNAEFTKFVPKKSILVIGNIYLNPELLNERSRI